MVPHPPARTRRHRCTDAPTSPTAPTPVRHPDAPSRQHLAFRGRVGVYVVSTTVLLVGIASLAVLDAEQNAPHSNIHNIGDALWWSLTTITTVGYGDYFPVTLAGRLVAVGLMASGVALLGTVTALLAQWFVEQVNNANEAGAAAIHEVAATAEAEIHAARQT